MLAAPCCSIVKRKKPGGVENVLLTPAGSHANAISCLFGFDSTGFQFLADLKVTALDGKLGLVIQFFIPLAE